MKPDRLKLILVLRKDTQIITSQSTTHMYIKSHICTVCFVRPDLGQIDSYTLGKRDTQSFLTFCKCFTIDNFLKLHDAIAFEFLLSLWINISSLSL